MHASFQCSTSSTYTLHIRTLCPHTYNQCAWAIYTYYMAAHRMQIISWHAINCVTRSKKFTVPLWWLWPSENSPRLTQNIVYSLSYFIALCDAINDFTTTNSYQSHWVLYTETWLNVNGNVFNRSGFEWQNLDVYRRWNWSISMKFAYDAEIVQRIHPTSHPLLLYHIHDIL